MNRYLLSTCLVCAPFCFGGEPSDLKTVSEEQEFTVDLRDPVFHYGVITTQSGGVISSHNLRIQAQEIAYTNKTEEGIAVKKIVAEGDLLMEYEGHTFVGKKLEYDFVTKRGTLLEARTSTDYWFIGGDEIHLEPDGSFLVSNAFLTTVEGQDHWWELRSSRIGVTDDSQLSLKNVRFRFFKIPLFWLPSFKFDLKLLKEPPIRYKFLWDQVLKQKISMRYELYSTETFDLFGRFDYQFKYGPGAAIETDYHSLDKRTTFLTKNYAAYNKIVPQETGDKRYRFQGLVTTHSTDERTNLHLSYDKLSDDKMPQDFKSDDFELNTQKRTILWVTHHGDDVFGRFNLQPRINRFYSVNQQLPYVAAGIRPMTLGSSGIVSDNWFSAGYLNYVFDSSLDNILPSTRAARLETNNSLYRPIPIQGVTLTPSVGIVGIFYSNNPHDQPIGQGILTYGLAAESTLTRKFDTIKHAIDPYLKFEGFSRPTAGINDHFIFNLYDGYTQLNLLRAGVKQRFYSTRHPTFAPNFSIDLYTYGFLSETAFHRTFPKAYTLFEINRPSLLIRSWIAYNIQQNLFDFANILANWTAAEEFAISVEFRHRSKYDWRKADRDNFVLDAARPIDTLVHSTVSDSRDTFLARFHLRFSPTWSCQFESHHGWGRRFEPGYNEFILKLRTLITGGWQLEFGLSYDPAKKWEAIVPTFKLMR